MVVSGRPDGSKDDLSSLGFSLLSVYYHTEWQERRLPRPDELGEVIALPPVRDAVMSIAAAMAADERSHDDALRVTAARLCFAQLARRAPAGRPRASAWYDWVTMVFEAFSQRQKHPYRQLERDSVLQEITRPRAPDARFMTAYSHRLFDAYTPFAMRRYCKSLSYAHRVTDTTVRVDVQRRASDFRNLVDPRKWASNVPNTWLKAFPFGAPLPKDRDQDPDANPASFGPKVPGSPFFEVAVWPSRLLELSTFRNVLQVAINVDVPKTIDDTVDIEIGFSYRQSECQTSSFLPGGKHYGGIDVDTGFGKCRDLPQDPGWCRLEARKRARFSKPPGPLNAIYGALGSITLPLLIEGLVLVGAQLPAQP